MSPKRSKVTAVPAPVPTPQPRMLTVRAAAEYLACTEWFVRCQVWAGKIPHLVFGKRIVFDKSDLDAFVESQKVGVSR